MGRNKKGIFGKSVDYHEDGGETIRRWELLDEIHGDGVPWMNWDWELV